MQSLKKKTCKIIIYTFLILMDVSLNINIHISHCMLIKSESKIRIKWQSHTKLIQITLNHFCMWLRVCLNFGFRFDFKHNKAKNMAINRLPFYHEFPVPIYCDFYIIFSDLAALEEKCEKFIDGFIHKSKSKYLFKGYKKGKGKKK